MARGASARPAACAWEGGRVSAFQNARLSHGGGGGDGVPSISRSWAWAMSSRLSPFDTASLCSWLSLSMKVTQSSSPGFGGSTWPCRVDGVEEKLRTDSEGAGRKTRGKARAGGELARTLGNVLGALLVLPKRRRYCGEGVCVEEGLRRVKARANVLEVVMAVREEDEGGRRVRTRRRTRREMRRRKTEYNWWCGSGV